VYVTERGTNQLSVYDTRDGQLKCRADVAADPYGVALAPDERTVYVVSGITRTLTALDTDTLSPRATAVLPREPRGVLASPDGRRVFVSHLAGAPLSAVQVGETLRPVVLPELPIPVEHDGAGSRVEPLPSQAWSLALEPRSARVVVPFMVSRTGREVPVVQRLDAYGAGSVEPERGEKTSFTVAVFDPARDLWEAVHSRRAMSARAIAGSPRVPAAVAVRPGDGTVFVASMGTGEVLPTIVARSAPASVPVATTGPARHPPMLEGLEGRRGPRPRGRTSLGVGVSPAEALALTAPCGVAVTRDGAVLAYSQVEHAVEFRGPGGRLRTSTGMETLAGDVARGRRLFYTANDPRLSSGGLSCGGCHPDGRDDGLTWFLSHGPRQTPTLAGRLVTPFNWVGSARSVEANIAQTIHRLGGTGITIMEVDALAAYLQRGLVVPQLPAARVTAEVTRGRELFHGVAGCNTCHDPGRNFTDGQLHELGGLRSDDVDRQFDTPSLRYVNATAPYFHDGRYASLRAMLTDPSHRMGHVEVLSPHDVDALTAYLETL
jgi:DNA-binding beta-propeller fold protein YncE/mono/diheme cytochrome c family protein